MSCSENIWMREPIASDRLFVPCFFKDGSGISGARFATGECLVPKKIVSQLYEIGYLCHYIPRMAR